MFRPVGSKPSFPELEEAILRFWKENHIFERSLEARRGGPLFMLYEGPPTANASPGVHHVLARVFKDIIPRYKTMRGYYAPRKGGWDTHGLPVELEVERELGFTSKADIEAYGIDRFNARCRESVFRYVKEWEAMTDRIGFWIDMAHAYVTLDNDYIETVWWIIKQLWERGLVYQGHKVTWHCPRCVTSLSDHEVALGYREDTEDPSIYVKFWLHVGGSQGHPFLDRLAGLNLKQTPQFLAWTTTPWTLHGNLALAVAPDAEYALVHTSEGENLLLAQATVKAVIKDHFEVLGTFPGTELVGLKYHPLFSKGGTGPGDYRIITGDFVSLTEGTGIVHIAPAFGDVDFEVGKAEGLSQNISEISLAGRFIGELIPERGDPIRVRDLFFKDADPLIIANLQQNGRLYRRERVVHTYPFCWRCDTPLINLVKSSWYIQTTAVKPALLSGNAQINWFPEHIKYGRFGNWLENNVDWALSRERYWGTPLPVWQCDACGHHECIGGRPELRAKPGVKGWRDDLDLHRPYIDEVTFACPQCGGRMRRLPEVIDCWFDSGAMPLAQFHYPFDNASLLEDGRFPADYICEAVDQTRGWFYSLHAISTLLFQRPSYRNVICLGHILDEAGEKMSKSRGNVVDPWQVINTYGADALRWYLFTASPAGSARRFSLGLVGEVVRRFFLTLWNTYSFFVTYANIDGFDPRRAAHPATPGAGPGHDLDRWVLSRLSRLTAAVTERLDGYDPTDAGRRIQDFVDELSNWYVRRSRRRFWKSESDADKWAAYSTLYRCLVTLAKLLAPFTPFLAEEMYRNLVATVDPEAPPSVHLTDFPQADPSVMDEGLEAGMALAMKIASLGRAARSQAGIKVRQPLSRALVLVRSPAEREWLGRLAPLIAEELNVKEVSPLSADQEAAVVAWEVRPNTQLLGPKYGRELPQVLHALSRQDPARVAALWQAGRAIPLDGYSLLPQEVKVERIPRPGYAIAAEAGYLVAVTTTLTPELADEGLARELVHRIQTMRRNAGFELTDRITVYYQGGEALGRVMTSSAAYIQQETLSLSLVAAEPPPQAYVETHRLTLGQGSTPQVVEAILGVVRHR